MSPSDSAWLHFWEALSTFGFVLVIAGCVIEGVEHFVKFKRGESPKKHLIEKIGWFILIGGLAIEFLAENRAKRIADRENARLAKEAGEARQLAGEANERASLANDRARLNEVQVAQLTHSNLLLTKEIMAVRPESQLITEVFADLYLEMGASAVNLSKLATLTNELILASITFSNSDISNRKFRFIGDREYIRDTGTKVTLSATLREDPFDRWEPRFGGISINQLRKLPISTIDDIVGANVEFKALSEMHPSVLNGRLRIRFSLGVEREGSISRTTNGVIIISVPTNRVTRPN